MSLALLLDDLAQRRIELNVEGGRLRYKAPAGALTAELREGIGAHKEALIDRLSGRPAAEPEILYSPVSPAQQRLWFIDQMQGRSHTYNIPMFLRLGGALDSAALRAALDDMVRRHQSLRCSFECHGETLRLAIRRDLRARWDEEALQEPLDERLREVGFHGFDLATAPLLLARLIRLGPDDHVLALNFHHIIADGWSLGIILRELAAGYESRLGGHAAELPPLDWQYTDYIQWQERLQQSGAMDADLTFWRERLAGAPDSTSMPADLERPSVQRFEGSAVPLELDADTTARLRARAREWGASLNHLTLAATAILVAEFTGNRDLVLAQPLANRTRRELEPIIGIFVNVVPLRLVVDKQTSVRELVAQVRHASTEAMDHCHLPFERLVEALGVRRDLSRSPVFQMAYNFLPRLERVTKFGGLQVEQLALPFENAISKYDCTFYLEESDGGVAGNIEYSTSLYRRESVERWAAAFASILDSVLQDPEASIATLPSLAGAQRRQIEDWCTGPTVPIPEQSPWARFEEVVCRAPGDVALEEGETRLSYAELARRAGIVSAKLASRGIGKGDRVGLLLPRGSDAVAAMLGVVRRGAVFVPFDAGEPRERLAMMAEQARLGAVIRGPGVADPISPAIAIEADTWSESPEVPPSIRAELEDPLYMIFTSGSTGVPKAVEVPWRGLCNTVQAFTRNFGVAPRERISQIASLSFDASLFEMWPSLLGGCTLVFVPEPLKLDPEALRDWIVRERIHVHLSPTPLAEELLDLHWPPDAPLRLLLTGGQALHKHPRPGLSYRVSNNYGPTEASIASTWCFVEASEDYGGLPPIGRPIDNTHLAILDESGSSAPIGAVGELYISGPGVALGYFDNPEATARSFVGLPGDSSTIWYRSGDLVRMMPGGELEFVARADGQVKLRGRRIEIGEVESGILRVPGVRQAAVRLEGEHLAAYVEINEGGPGPDQIRRQLRTKLPEYMIPSFFTMLDKLPRQKSGKIDLKAIPQHDPWESSDRTAASPAPASVLEAAISRAWARVLNGPVPGVDDNFFDLGGHSLLLVRLKEQIRRETGREIGILELFRHPTIARQAAYLEKLADAKPERRQAARRAPAANDIAIIGMAGRFPDADNIEEFWNNLREGRDSIRMFGREEMLAAGVPPELVDSPDYVPANAILRDIEYFDATFFGISAREAEVMDPQQRLLLEEAWHTFEDAGYDPAQIKERVGVFVGSSLSAYLAENVMPRKDIMETLGGFAVLMHNDKDFAATRISYKLDLRGPSLSVNTACSTSLVAIHQAVTALRDGQCELALAGAACVRSRQIDGYRYEEGGVLSRDGRCRAFDADSSGMVGGNGVGLVLLKPLEAALADGDHVRAVIKGIAVNNDGANKVGFTAPSICGQSLVVQDALERAGVDPQTVSYVEAHGTGTQLGDSIEVAALAENYAPAGVRATPLYLGSVKTNVGHLDAAAGVTGLIKTTLCLSEGTLVPSLHFRTPNPQIRWPGESLRVSTRTERFRESLEPLRAAVSALGIGGTNAHAVLEKAPRRPVDDGGADAASPALLLLSGKSPEALDANVATLADWLGRHPEARLRDAAHTLAFGRRHWECRRAVSATSAAEAAVLLAEPDRSIDRADGAAFLFTGIGILKAGMGRALYGRSPVFRASIDKSAGILEPVLGLDIRSPLLAESGDPAARAALSEERVSQPVVVALQYALARFWMDLGISPAVLVGHSLGEWVSACLAGVFALPDALRLVSLRGHLMESQPRGAMLAVSLSESQVAARLPSGLDVAAINAVEQIVVAGPAEAIREFGSKLGAEGIRSKRLPVTVAAHSSLMEPVLDRFRAAVAAAPRHAPNPGMAVVSCVTGAHLDAGQLQSPDYWAGHIRRPVRFADALGTLWASAGLALLECGPSQTLCHIARRDDRRPAGRALVGSLDGEADREADWRRVLESAGALWMAGLPLDLDKLFGIQGKGKRTSLPGYAFQRRRYWLDTVPAPSIEEEQPAAPRLVTSNASPAEEQVIAIMHELLGARPLSRNSDFFLNGGDSLLAVRLTSRIGEVFGVRPAQVQVMNARTPASIASLLGAGEALGEAADKADGCVVRLAAGNDRLPPIVLIHAVGGGIFIYRELLQALATAHPVYGLQAPGLWDTAAPIEGLRKQAEHYHACLLRAGIKRPIMIGGSSYGGLVCYELDALYQQSGHKTSLVALFDSPGPGHMPRRLESEAEICAYMLSRDIKVRNFAADLARMQALDHEGRFALLLDYMRETVMPHASAVDVERQLRVFRQNLTNMWNWVPQPHDARIFFCKAREHTALLANGPELAWVPLARAGIEILPMPGDHSSMLSFPHVSFVANEINRRLPLAPASVA